MYDVPVSFANRAESGVFNMEAAIAEHGGTWCWTGIFSLFSLFSRLTVSLVLVAKLISPD